MLDKVRHAIIIYARMMGLMVGTIVWTIYFELKPNPGLTARIRQPRHFQDTSATANGENA